jgi:hypothetical protein
VARRNASSRALGVALAASALSGTPRVMAQAADPCLSAPTDGQQQQRAGKLLEARESFLACSRNTCPKEIVQDCEHWLRDVNDALPSVIFAVRDAEGHDLLDARVSIDGGDPVAITALGVPLDPGEHSFTFHREGAPDVEQKALLRAGEKNRAITAKFAGSPVTHPALPPPTTTPAPPAETTRPVPVAAWVTAGIGVAAFAFFGTFGALGVSERSAYGCASGCSANEKSTVDVKFDVADVSLVTGVVALGAATWIYLARPPVTASPRTGGFFDLRASPGGGVAVVGARF